MHRPLPPPWDRFVPFAKRCFVWTVFFAVLWVLRSFLFMVFLTFVFGYLQAHGVEGLHRRVGGHRRMACVLVFVILLLVLLGIGYFVGPSMVKQATDFLSNATQHEATLNAAIENLRTKMPLLRDPMFDFKATDILGLVFGSSHDSALGLLVARLRQALTLGTQFLLALLFSFLVVLDLPNIARGVGSLRETKLRLIYDEVSDTVFQFGRILGKTLEAQLMIALCNTALTCLGLWFLGLPSLAFLSTVVFLCSFIPVAGVFISSVPICLTALAMANGGAGLTLVCIAFICLIHAIEAYVLNPRIVGAHLKINPVIVLAILVIGHDLFGLWGLILGVPTFHYVFAHAIQHRKPATPAVAA